ncbi:MULTISPECIES: hypothetical protein [Paracoccus]|jgi:hypothetical protein|uniref:hypothetical protein n=1 Tax=Paracoccus TaxID=265 RepID=UPI0033651E93
MTLFLTNSLGGEKQPFIPRNPREVRIYACGPTVYDYAHIGNARPAVVFDVLVRLFRLPDPQQALLAMTTAARNAPLMLAVTAVAIPDQPSTLATIVIGMLVEFPHLTALKQVLLARRHRKGATP